MPLRDHFHGPGRKAGRWERVHAQWPAMMVVALNRTLPPKYVAGASIHHGAFAAVDVAAAERDEPAVPSPDSADAGGTTTAVWAPARPTWAVDIDPPDVDEYEVRVYDVEAGERLVAAVEIVSPGNKDRPASRDAFVSRCHALLQQDVCVVIVDPVTDRPANLYAELAERMGAARPAVASSPIYAVSCRGINARGRWRVEAWEHELTVGLPLPTVPLWLTDRLSVPLELETTYQDTCRGLRLA